MEEEKSGISLSDIFKRIWSQKWLALIIAAVIAVVGTLALYFGYNPMKKEYEVNFTLELPNDDANLTYQYPDGSPFFYVDLISKTTLEEVVADADGRYDKIDVAKMVEKNDISVSVDLIVTNAGSNSIIEKNYTIKVLAKYFKDDDVARDFLNDVANYPCKYLSNLKIEYDGALKQFDEADDYSKQIEYLEKQMSFIKQSYNALISEYDGNLTVGGGKTLRTCLEEVTAYENSYEYKNLKADLLSNGYLKGSNAADKDGILANYQLELEQLKRDLEKEEFILEQMKTDSDTQANSEAIRSQARIVADLNERKNELEKLTNEGYVDTEGVFAAKLKKVYDKLAEYTDGLKTNTVSVYTNVSKAFFNNSNIISENGGFGLIVSFAVSVVAGLIIAMIAAYIVGWAKANKAGNTAETAVPAQQSDAVLEAATSEDTTDKK